MNMQARTWETIAMALPSANLNKLARDLRKEGYTVTRDNTARTLLAQLDGRDVLRAVQMGRGPWIVRAVVGLITKQEV